MMSETLEVSSNTAPRELSSGLRSVLGMLDTLGAKRDDTSLREFCREAQGFFAYMCKAW